jgi:hypothetical protein
MPNSYSTSSRPALSHGAAAVGLLLVLSLLAGCQSSASAPPADSKPADVANLTPVGTGARRPEPATGAA